MPVFRTKKEAFEWLSTGKKTVDIRKGKPVLGGVAVYLSGRNVLRMKIVNAQTGELREVVRLDNYKVVIPTAVNLDEAVIYVQSLYPEYVGVFTAYYIAPLEL